MVSAGAAILLRLY